jgi:membrane associated rhomboid family serine protease
MFPLYDNNPTERTPVVTFLLVAVNVLVFLWMSRLPDWRQELITYQHGFVPARVMQLRQPLPIRVPVKVAVEDPFWGERIERRAIVLEPSPAEIGASLITCMFMHGSWMHLLSNMWFLWLFGNNVEDRLGKFFYVFLYLLGGLLASGLHWMMEPTSTAPVIGASGAIAAVLGAYAVTWPWARVSCLVFLVVFVTIIDVPALIVLGSWFVLQVLGGQRALNSPIAGGVAWWAHVGGFLAGMFLMPLLCTLLGRGGSDEIAQAVE